MKRLGVTVAAMAVFAVWGSVWVHAQASDIMGRIRGEVLDQDGQPVPDVAIEVVHEASGKKIILKSDKKGGFIRVGIAEGNYIFTFTKPGYKTTKTKLWISLAGWVTEIPPVTLQALPPEAAAAVAAPGAPGTGSPKAGPAFVAVEAEALAAMQGAFAQAVEAEKAGRPEEAETIYKDILTKAPGLSEAHYNLGRLYGQRQDWAGAETELRKSIELQPDRSDSYLVLAGVLKGAGRNEEGEKMFADAAARFGQDAVFQFALGLRHFNAGESDAAAAAFQKVRELDPANPEPIYYLGAIAVGNNRVAEAVALLESYLAATGQDPKNLALAQDLLKAIKPGPKK